MTVQQLIDRLNAIKDKSRIVILQKDGEGKGYSPLAGMDDNCTYAAVTTWHGAVSIETLTDELRRRGFDEEDRKGGVPCLVLAPVN